MFVAVYATNANSVVGDSYIKYFIYYKRKVSLLPNRAFPPSFGVDSEPSEDESTVRQKDPRTESSCKSTVR